MNLRLLLAASAAIALATAASGAMAANQSQATAAINVVVSDPLSVANKQDMALGTILKPTTGTGTTFALSNSGIVTANGLAHSGTTQPAQFTVTGSPGATFTTSTQILSGNLTGVTNGLGSFTLTEDTPNPTSIPSTGADTTHAVLSYGASFTISPTTIAQPYSGVVQVTVAYP